MVSQSAVTAAHPRAVERVPDLVQVLKVGRAAALLLLTAVRRRSTRAAPRVCVWVGGVAVFFLPSF